MKKKTKININFNDLTSELFDFFKKTTAVPPWMIKKGRTDKWTEVELPILKHMVTQLAQKHAKAAEESNETYSKRRNDIQQIVEKRRKRLEAYTRRRRVVVAGEKNKFVIAGQVTDKRTGVGLPNVKVNTFGIDRKDEGRIDSTHTDALGYYRIEYDEVDFKDLGEEMPQIYIEVVDENEKALYTSPKPFVQKTGKSEHLDVVLEGDNVPSSLAAGTKIDRSITERLKVLNRRNRRLTSST